MVSFLLRFDKSLLQNTFAFYVKVFSKNFSCGFELNGQLMLMIEDDRVGMKSQTSKQKIELCPCRGGTALYTIG